MQTITLATKQQLDIYINPQRQRLLRALTIEGKPMTPKQLSQALGISASATQHHIAKLVSLGVVEPSHTQQIRGITAHYYRAVAVTVRIGCIGAVDGNDQRIAIIQNGVNDVLTGFVRHASAQVEAIASATIAKNAGIVARQDTPSDVSTEPESPLPVPLGDVLWGVTRLNESEAATLMDIIRHFLHEHEAPAEGKQPWEYALIAYPTKEENHA